MQARGRLASLVQLKSMKYSAIRKITRLALNYGDALLSWWFLPGICFSENTNISGALYSPFYM